MDTAGGRPGAMGRRAFLKATGLAGAGFALAVQPVSAETVRTPETGLITRDLFVERAGARIPVYEARPPGKGPFPAVIVIHEIFGQHEHIRDVTRRFAHEGFIAAAPELYFREGGVGHLSSFDDIRKVVRAVPDRQMLDDLGAVLRHLKGLAQSNGKVGVTGFCWGGGATWLLVADNPDVAAGVAWYGRLTNWGEGKLHPHNPVALAERMHAPVLGLYGGQDRGIPVADVETMKAALTRHRKHHEFVVYPEAPHAFFADYRQSYRPEAARDAWRRAVAWLKEFTA